jgi:hypothetical protein
VQLSGGIDTISVIPESGFSAEAEEIKAGAVKSWRSE